MWRIYKFFRFIKRLFLWIPTIWRIENWDYEYFLDLVVLQLKQMEIALRTDTHSLNASSRARQIRIVLEHIKRYKNIDDYAEHVSYQEYLDNEYWVPAGDNCVQLCYKDEALERKHFLIEKRLGGLESWHLHESFRLINKYIQSWWV